MTLFLHGIVLLIAGYFIYGRMVERIIGADDRPTPAQTHYDGLDYVELPHWKNMLIQLLNIAGVGPVIGVILGIKFGAIVFLIIPIGNMIGGAVHDFLGGMMSIRAKGVNLPILVRRNLGTGYYFFFSIAMMILLLLVVAVFINIPANLIDGFVPSAKIFWWAVGGIFLYYLAATMFPIDAIIGRIYPLFGLMLLIGTGAIFVALLIEAIQNPAILQESEVFKQGKLTDPIIPCLFVTIACGIMSGFHATQSPIVARTMRSERQARSTFYGMMIAEGLIAMTWAAAGLAIYNILPETLTQPATSVLRTITTHFLGSGVGAMTIIAVIILAVTSGDTAMRSLRLSIGEILKLNQKPFFNRLIICIPLAVIVSFLLWWSNQNAKTFGILWNYFAWGNQILAASTLMAATVWLYRRGKPTLIAIIPGAFMTFVVLSYILWTSKEHGGPVGLGLDIHTAYIYAGIDTALLVLWVYMFPARIKLEKDEEDDQSCPAQTLPDQEKSA